MLISEIYKIETDRLILRFPLTEDIAVTFSASRYKGFNDGMFWDPPQTADELVEPFKNSVKAWHNDTAYSFSIVKKQDNLFIGRISIRKEESPEAWNLGFWIHPEHQNKGYMTEAALAIIGFGFTILNAEKISACHAIWNKASEAVLKNCGMVFSTYIERGFIKKGEWIDENRLEITRTDWLKTNSI